MGSSNFEPTKASPGMYMSNSGQVYSFDSNNAPTTQAYAGKLFGLPLIASRVGPEGYDYYGDYGYLKPFEMPGLNSGNRGGMFAMPTFNPNQILERQITKADQRANSIDTSAMLSRMTGKK
jgi:hypothetical protein